MALTPYENRDPPNIRNAINGGLNVAPTPSRRKEPRGKDKKRGPR